MNTYQVKVKYSFEGVVEVRAESKNEAKEIVKTSFGIICEVPKPSWESNHPDDEGIVDWNIETHPSSETIK